MTPTGLIFKIMLQLDKYYHFTAGFIIGILSLIYHLAFGLVGTEIKIAALLMPVVVGTAKELYDWKFKKSKFDIYDLLATIAGGWSVAPAVFIIF